MTDAEIEEKFLDLAAPVLGSSAAGEVAARCWHIEDIDDLGLIARSCRGRSR